MTENNSKHEILKETIGHIKRAMPDNIMGSIYVERVIFGIYFSGVKLSNGYGGFCYTWRNIIPKIPSCFENGKCMPDSGKLKGMSVGTVLEEMFNGNPLKKMMGIAVINALSNTIWAQEPPLDYIIKSHTDALDYVEIGETDYVVLVGALPYLQKLKARGKPFRVLELDPEMLKEDEMPFYIPGERCSEEIPRADMLISTGTTLLNDTLEDLLALARPSTRLIMYGPTCTMLPYAFFRRGITKIVGMKVIAPDQFLDIISEAGCGYHFLDGTIDRIVITR